MKTQEGNAIVISRSDIGIEYYAELIARDGTYYIQWHDAGCLGINRLVGATTTKQAMREFRVQVVSERNRVQREMQE